MDKDMKKIVKAALARNWVRLPSGKHHVIQHTSGRKVLISSSPSDRNASRNVQNDIDRVEREAA